MQKFIIYIILIFMCCFPIGCWIGSIYRLCKCDFQPSYKAEVIHSVAVIVAPVSMVTVWLDVGK